jgi:hypothetical protein
MNNFNFLYMLVKQFKNAKDIPHLTGALQQSSIFRQACMKVHNAKARILKQIHDEAFPEEKHNTHLTPHHRENNKHKK